MVKAKGPLKNSSKNKSTDPTISRKSQHIDLCVNEEVNSLSLAGWDDIRLPHRALPEISFAQVNLACEFLNLKLKSPFLVSSMTGGSALGEKINARLASFAQARGICMGVGSQRVQLENRDKGLFALRKCAPKAYLFANIGIVQLNYGVGVDDCAWLVDQLEAQALILHANVLQEAIQKEGDRDFSHLAKHISKLKKVIKVPLILKETGCGLDVRSSRLAIDAGIDALDVAGLGGTHWGYIEGLRHEDRKALGELFRDWGIPTAEALRALSSDPYSSWVPLIASGGLRHGLDAARALYLGASLCGMALPFLKAAMESEDALHKFLDQCEESLKISLFCTGASDVKRLQDFQKEHSAAEKIKGALTYEEQPRKRLL